MMLVLDRCPIHMSSTYVASIIYEVSRQIIRLKFFCQLLNFLQFLWLSQQLILLNF